MQQLEVLTLFGSVDYDADYDYKQQAASIQGSTTDFLICAVSARHALPIFTVDNDFHHINSILP